MDSKKLITDYLSVLTNTDMTDTALNLFEAGVLTSLDVLDLLAFIEKTFKVEIPVDEIDMDNFGSVDCLTVLVDKLTVQEV